MQADGLTYFQVAEYESDLAVAVDRYTEQTAGTVRLAIQAARKVLTEYEHQYPGFFKALEPLPVRHQDPLMVRKMKMAAQKAGVGPMAAVAGAVSEAVGRQLLTECNEVIIENGGDLFIRSSQPRRVAVDAKTSGFGALQLEVAPDEYPFGVCTSSGTTGHSLSFGKADAATIISQDVLLADAMATALGNRIQTKEDIGRAIDWAKEVPGVLGILVIADGSLGAWGRIKLI